MFGIVYLCIAGFILVAYVLCNTEMLDKNYHNHMKIEGLCRRCILHLIYVIYS